MNSVIFIDYDNTIFSHKTWSIPKSALAALEGLKDTGYKVVVATGRPFTGTTLPAEFEGVSSLTVWSAQTALILKRKGIFYGKNILIPSCKSRLWITLFQKTTA